MNQFKITVNGNDYFVNVENLQENSAQVEVNGLSFDVGFEDATGMSYTPSAASEPKKEVAAAPAVKVAKPATAPAAKPAAAPVAKPASASSAGGAAIVSPLPGVIIDIKVKVGDEVKSGQQVLVLEAMKMENNINADRDGKVLEIKVGKGDSVLEGADLIIIG